MSVPAPSPPFPPPEPRRRSLPRARTASRAPRERCAREPYGLSELRDAGPGCRAACPRALLPPRLRVSTRAAAGNPTSRSGYQKKRRTPLARPAVCAYCSHGKRGLPLKGSGISLGRLRSARENRESGRRSGTGGLRSGRVGPVAPCLFASARPGPAPPPRPLPACRVHNAPGGAYPGSISAPPPDPPAQTGHEKTQDPQNVPPFCVLRASLWPMNWPREGTETTSQQNSGSRFSKFRFLAIGVGLPQR